MLAGLCYDAERKGFAGSKDSREFFKLLSGPGISDGDLDKARKEVNKIFNV